MKKCILLIDDDADELEIFSEALAEINRPMSCIHSQGAAAALTVLNIVKPDYIFLDVNMPGINGFKCLEEMKKIRSLSDVPIIFYSNWITDDIYKKAIEAGASACIKKPKTVDTLAQILKGIFSMNAQLKHVLFDKGKSN